jgi:hypothetical protein
MGILAKVLQSSVKLFALGIGQFQGFGHAGDAVPNIFNHLDAFRAAQLKQIGQGNLAHEWTIIPLPICF